MLLVRGRKGRAISTWFWEREGEKGSAIETCQDSFKPKPTTNIATITDEIEQTFALMTMKKTTFKIPYIPVLISSKIPNNNPFPSSHNHIYQGMGMKSNKELPGERSLVLHTDFYNK